MWTSPIIRVNGKLNTVNDTVAGGVTSIGSRAKFGGQLGKLVAFDSDQIQSMFSSTIGTLYAGVYRYVRLKATSTAIVRGQTLFWDNASAVADYVVTADQTTTTLAGSSIAGVALSVITPGNYGFVQVGGVATVKYRAAITGTAATGRPVVIATAGGADLGLADIVDTAGIEPIQMGWAIELPANGALRTINMNNFYSFRQ